MNLWAMFLTLRFKVFHDVILWCLDEAETYLFQKVKTATLHSLTLLAVKR